MTVDANGLSRAWPTTNELGMVELATAPDCTTRYHGMFKQATLLVVDIGGPSETLFTRGERDAAIGMAKSQNLSIAPIVASELCHDAVLAVIGH